MQKVKVNKKEKKKYLSQDPRIGDVMNSLVAQYKLPKSTYGDFEKAVALARKFNDEVVRPAYKEVELSIFKDNEYLERDILKKANEWGLLTLWVPKIFGGGNMSLLSMYAFFEEIASVCTGIANLIGGVYLGFSTICATWNIRLMKELLRDVKNGEKTGEPCAISLAITEPEAGTDVEETILMDRARIGTIVEKVKGGYIVNGRKIFISNGHQSTWHIMVAWEDRKKPSESIIIFAVKTGMKGFSFGKHENKMGQKACVASELIFDDCFIPDKYVCLCMDDLEKFKRPSDEIAKDAIDFVLSTTRAAVGAFGIGCARGAYETALNYACQKKVGGKTLINHQWAQITLAEMYKNVNMGRATYMEAVYANGMKGMAKLLLKKSVSAYLRFFPKWYFKLISPLLNLKIATWFFRKYYYDWYNKEDADVTSGWGSIAKFGDTDIGALNSAMAIELMGIDGCRHDIGAEKYLRDVKLLQIYEGTNQLNRMTLFMKLISRDAPGVELI